MSEKKVDYGARAQQVYDVSEKIREGVIDAVQSWRSKVREAQKGGDYNPKTSEELFTSTMDQYLVEAFIGGEDNLPKDEGEKEVLIGQLRKLIGYDRVLPLIRGQVYDRNVGLKIENNVGHLTGQSLGMAFGGNTKAEIERDPDNIVDFQKYVNTKAKETGRDVEAKFKHIGDHLGELYDLDSGPLMWDREKLKNRLDSKRLGLEEKLVA